MTSVPQNTTDPYNVDSTTGTGHHRNIGNELGTGHRLHTSDEPLPGQGAGTGVHDYPPGNTIPYTHQAVHPHHNARHGDHDNLGTAQQHPQELNQPTDAGGGRAAHGANAFHSDRPPGAGPAQGALTSSGSFPFFISSVKFQYRNWRWRGWPGQCAD